MRKSSKHETLQQITDRLIAQGCNTYSKRSDQYIKGIYSTHVYDGNDKAIIACSKEGPTKRLVDWVCGLGSNLNGYYNNFTFPSVYEPSLAKLVKERFPFIDKMKFLKTGSAACDAAVRIARAYWQNKHKYDKNCLARGLGMGYHGCGNVFISSEQPGTGTQWEGYSKRDNFKDLFASIDTYKNLLAYVIIEPVMLSMNVKKELLELRRLCTKHDICLIFDEIVTGYRMPKFCASSYFGIYPDIICLGKAIANGYPLAIVAGKKKYMDTPNYFISNTHNGEESSLIAAIKTMNDIKETDMDDLWRRGKYFQERFNRLWPEKIKLIGIPTRATWEGDETIRAKFWQEMCKRGYIFGRAWFINFAHTTPVIDMTLEDAKQALKQIRAGKVRLEGQLPQPIFKRY